MKNNEDNKKRSRANVPLLLFYSVTGIVTSLLLSLIAVFFVNSEKISPDTIPLISSVFVLIGGALTSFLSAKKFGKPLLTALLQSLIFLILLYLTGALVYGRLLPSAIPTETISFCIAGMLAGAIASALKAQKKFK